MILHLITDRRRLAGETSPWAVQRRCLLAQVRFAVEADVDVVQVRERDLDAAVLFGLVRDCVDITAGSRTRIVVNDRLDVALAAGAHGVHLRGDSMPPAVARSIVPHRFLIGQSVHDADAAAAADRQVDYLIAGTVWATVSKPVEHRLLGLAGLAGMVRAAAVPVLAIGGVTPDRLPELTAQGAAGFAAIGMFIRETTPADKLVECRAMPLHDLARGVAR